MHCARIALAGAALVVGLGCGSKDASGTAGAPAASAAQSAAPASEVASTPAGGDAARVAAEQIFSTRCFTCHGAAGDGNGPGSANLMPKPRNFTDPTWQASVDDDHIAKIIQYGGAAVGKSPTMPGNPDLMSKPEVVQALVAHIRSLSAAK